MADFADRALIMALAWGALAFGAVYPWAYWPLAVVCGGLGLWAIGHTSAWRDRQLLWLGGALAIVAIAMAVQLVPLSYGTVQRASPALDLVLRSSTLLFTPPPEHSLSLSPASTAAALGLFAGGSLLVLGWSAMLIRRRRLEWIARELVLLGVALAVFGIAQKAFLNPVDPLHRLVYGFWQPRQGGDIFGPFINRNHFAGWMAMALPIALGYAAALSSELPVSAGESWRRWMRWSLSKAAGPLPIVMFGALLMGMSVVASGSRSGMAAVAVGIATFVALAAGRAGSHRARIRLALAGLLLIAAMVVWAGGAIVAQRFSRSGADLPERVNAWSDTVRIIRDFPVFGTGLGGFWRAMIVYQRENRDRIYFQAHNDYLQFAAEGGLLVGIPAMAALVLIVRIVRRRVRLPSEAPFHRWLRLGAISGLVAIAAQSLVEFSLQMPGNMMLCAFLVAVAMHRAPRGEAPRDLTHYAPGV